MNKKVFDKKSFIEKAKEKGYFCGVTDALPTQFTLNNIGLPAGLLTQISPEIIKQIFNKRTANDIVGDFYKSGDWKDQDILVPYVELTGGVKPYADKNNPTFVNQNINFDKAGHYRFSVAYSVGDLMSEQLATARINEAEYKLSAATETLMIEMNRVAFYGYIDNQGGQLLVEGLLNNSRLNPYETSPKVFTSGATSFQDIMDIFGEAIGKLTAQTGQNVDYTSEIKVAISQTAFQTLLTKFAPTGDKTVLQALQETYKNIRFIPSVDLDNANNNQNVMYLIAESGAGGNLPTARLGFSEIIKAGNVVNDYNSYSQVLSNGSFGCLIYKPSHIVRYTNI